MAELAHFARKVKFKLGNGERIKLWGDIWCGEVMLLEKLPQLYNIAANREGWVANYLEWIGETPIWNVIFTRNLQD